MLIYLFNSRLFKCFVSFLFILSVVACTKTTESSGKYRLYFRGENIHQEWIATLDDLSAGNIDLMEKGNALDSDIYYDFYYHKGQYYDIDRPDKIRKYELRKDGQPFLVDSCVIENMTEIETHTWADDTTLIVVGLDSAHRNPVYTIIDTERFLVKQSGNIPIPDDGSYQRTSVGFVAVSDEVMYVTYVYHNTSPGDYTTSEEISLVALDYPRMTLRNHSTNGRSTYQMKNGRHQPTMALGNDNKFYFITNTSNGFGRIETIPSGVLRVNIKEKNIDNEFFVNISDSLKSCYPTAIWHMYENVFLIKCERTDLISSWSDYITDRVFEYYTLDAVHNRIERLDLPLDTPWYTNNVIVDDGIAYIGNNAEDGYTFWSFDPKTNTLRKGAKIDASVKRIFSIDLN